MVAFFGYGFVMLTAFAILAADIMLKVSADRSDSIWVSSGFWAASVLYACCAWPIYMSLKTVTLGQMGVAFAVFSLLGTCLIGVMFFNEARGARELLGIGLAVSALVVMARIY